jgi:succinyl-CoA synthetase alpha subunit
MSLEVRIRKSEFKDSVILMNASQRLKDNVNIEDALIVMGTESNKSILRDLDLINEDARNAGPNDLVVAYRSTEGCDSDEIEKLLKTLFLQEGTSDKDEKRAFSTLQLAFEQNTTANIALVSVPGRFAYFEAKKALELGLHVVIFSANVSLDHEKELKRLASDKGLLCMGPDCGVCNIGGFALVLASIVKKGKVGIVGPSGSGLQELSVLIERNGHGVTHVLGSGGRDLAAEIGGSATIAGIKVLDSDRDTGVIVVFLKSAPDNVLSKVHSTIQQCMKPAVVCFLGGESDALSGESYVLTKTLGEAAQVTDSIVRGETIQSVKPFRENEGTIIELASSIKQRMGNLEARFMGLFGAGTFMAQAHSIFKEFNFRLYDYEEFENEYASDIKHLAIDLGDEKYTEGRPHPVIDPLPYRVYMKKAIEKQKPSVVLFDLILGPAMHPDPAGYIAETIKDMRSEGNDAVFVATVCGSESDPQGKSKQIRTLEELGVIVFSSITEATYFCLLLIQEGSPDSILKDITQTLPLKREAPTKMLQGTREEATSMDVPEIINVGIELFHQSLEKQNAKVHQVEWKPPAEGNIEIINMLDELKNSGMMFDSILSANEEAYKRIVESEPIWIGVSRAGEVVQGLEKNMVLHTGPPIEIDDMHPSHRNGVIGGILFEGLADDPEDAVRKVKNGDVKLLPGVDLGVPNGGMAPTTFSMPVIVAENSVYGNRGFCPIQEGPSYQALRWGVFNSEVKERWVWFQQVLGPNLNEILQRIGGYNLKSNVARSLQMGDENHSREHGSTLLMIASLASEIVKQDLSGKEMQRIFTFLNSAERFALHIHIAGAYSVMSSVREVENSSVVYAMGGNGRQIGIKVAAGGDEWFTADAPFIEGRYLNPNWTMNDTVPFAGDSCVVEVYGLGGLAAAASPAVTLMAGGTMKDALKRTEEMWSITMGKNPNYAIPNLDFKGTPAGIDILKVLETGIVPQSHAGIIHKDGGQAGAGVAYVPMECFTKAFRVLNKKYMKRRL